MYNRFQSTIEKIIEGYGTPDEVAAAYKEIEVYTSPYKKIEVSPSTYKEIDAGTPNQIVSKGNNRRSWYLRLFGIMADSKAWGALLYLLLSLPLGIIYFTWAITGLSLSLGLLVLVIGIPFVSVTLLSAIQATGFLAFTLTGLPPAEHTSLCWTHKLVRNFITWSSQLK